MIFPESRGSPEWADESDGREYRLRQSFQREADRQERERIRDENKAKMDRLRHRIDTGGWQAQDRASRALGYGGRSRDLLDDLIDQAGDDPLTQYDAGRALARSAMGLPPPLDTAAKVREWLRGNGSYNGGPR